VTFACETFEPAIKADPLERLAPPASRERRGQFALILAGCFFAHALILAAFLAKDLPTSAKATQAEEIPVEIVAELPAEQKPEPMPKSLPPPPDLVTPPAVKEKPPPEKVQLDDVRAAFDAPAAGNASDTRKAEQEKETQAPRQAPPPKLLTPEPAQNKPEQEKAAAPSEEKAAEASAPSEPQKLADLEPDAEALDKAQPESKAKPKEKPAPKPTKGPPAQGKRSTVAQQLAALSPAPSYSFGSAAKSAPISGGTEKASYESLLFGLISRQLHLPPQARANHLVHVGRIGLFVDELGNLTHQALYLASGDPALDAAWLAAVKRAAPFPPPPRNLPHGFLLQYSNEE
jgi:periplasmic protein TonB